MKNACKEGASVNKSVFLTGGRAAEIIYNIWKSKYPVSELTGIDFYFGDERCVPSSSSLSNYGMTMSSLFSDDIPVGCNIFPMAEKYEYPELAAQEYAELLPQKIDLLILSVGEDGHIASLFPDSDSLFEYASLVTVVLDPAGIKRLTITPKTIENASEVVVIAYGQLKKNLYQIAQHSHSTASFPARLVVDASWIIDDEIESIAKQLWEKLEAKSI